MTAHTLTPTRDRIASAKADYAVCLTAYVAHLDDCSERCPGVLCFTGQRLLADADAASWRLDAARRLMGGVR